MTHSCFESSDQREVSSATPRKSCPHTRRREKDLSTISAAAGTGSRAGKPRETLPLTLSSQVWFQFERQSCSTFHTSWDNEKIILEAVFCTSELKSKDQNLLEIMNSMVD